MILINHRVNTIQKLKDTPKEYGVEIDLRPYRDRVILNHEPFEDGEDFEEFLKHYDHKLLILNVKAEGIEKRIVELVNKYGVKDFFFLDVTFPFMIKYIKNGWNQFAARFSEFESIETCLNLKGKVEWVFVDNFTRLPIENDSFKTLKKYFKICIVSPELLKRVDEIELTKKIIKEYDVDAILTDNLESWKE